MSTLEAKLEVAKTIIPPVSRKEDFETTTKLSRIMEIALEDLEEAEKDNVKINMANWLVYQRAPVYKPWGATQCFACFAGCVMRNTFNVKGEDVPSWFRSVGTISYGPYTGENISARLYALDSVRSQHFHSAWELMYGSDNGPEWIHQAPHFPSYDSDPEKFKHGIRDSIDFFRENGY